MPAPPDAVIIGAWNKPSESVSSVSRSKVTSRQDSSISCESVVKPDESLTPLSPRASRPAEDLVRLCRRKSLDELQANHDAAITSAAAVVPGDSLSVTARTRQILDVTTKHASALPRAGWFLLSFVGILDFYQGTLWRVLAHCILAVQMLIVIGSTFVLSTWRGSVQHIEPSSSTQLVKGSLNIDLELKEMFQGFDLRMKLCVLASRQGTFDFNGSVSAGHPTRSGEPPPIQDHLSPWTY